MRVLLTRLFFGFVLMSAITSGATTPAAAKTVCINVKSYYQEGCPSACASPEWILDYWYGPTTMVTPVPPAKVMPPKPTKITSCKAVVGGSPPTLGYCMATMCGPSNASLREGDVSFRGVLNDPPKVPLPCGAPNNPCPSRSSTVVGPGILEGGSGFATQGPAAAGVAPLGSAATGNAPGSGNAPGAPATGRIR